MYNSIMEVHLKKVSTVENYKKGESQNSVLVIPRKPANLPPTKWNDQIISGVQSSPYKNGMKN